MSYSLQRNFWIFSILLFFLSTLFVQSVYAQTTCGTITDQFGNVKPINNCLNPFNTTPTTPSIGQLTIDSQTVNEGGNITVALNQPLTTAIQIAPHTFSYQLDVYQKVGQDFIYQDGFRMFDTPALTFLEAGTYTAVITVNPAPVLIQQTLFQKLLAFFVPTAYANIIMPAPGGTTEVKAVTFEVIDVAVVPPKPASVLFLPGIQASRLYTAGAFGTENQLWEPLFNAEVKKLAMTDSGVSVNNIYTRDVIDSLIDGSLIYKNFLEYFQTAKADGTISDWKAFPYDWRYDVFDIVQNGTTYGASGLIAPSNPVTTLKVLAAESNSKVTIIAHSNGGLLAKAIMMELEKEGKADLVDKIIFLATPQFGTPKAVAAMLHGHDQAKVWGWVIDADTARHTMRNMPGAYSLLPSALYFNSIDTPVIAFYNSAGTQAWRDTYGPTINTVSELSSFMADSNGGRATTTDLDIPLYENGNMLITATEKHATLLDSWVAPSSTKVFEIVGTGLETVDYFTYRNFQTESCILGLFDCAVVDYIAPIPHVTTRGDQTVLVSSAEAYQGDKTTYYLDLEKNRKSGNLFVQHASIGESPFTQSLITNILTGTTTPVLYASTTEPIYTSSRDLISMHSPVNISVQDEFGRTIKKSGTGSSTIITEDIPGGTYMEFAGSKYIIVPSNINYTVSLQGYATGTYTLLIEHQIGDATTTPVYEYSLVKTTPKMQATFFKTNNIFSNLQIDLNGDGIVDSVTTLSGEEVEDEETDDGDNKDKDKKDKKDKEKHKDKSDKKHNQHKEGKQSKKDKDKHEDN